MSIDPVCGMTVDPARTPYHARYQGVDYHFCSANCRKRFKQQPAAFAMPAAEAAPPPEGAVYFCPMHPEVVSSHPGVCPKCGMALEPRASLAMGGESPHLRDLRNRFVVSLAFTLPVVLLMALDFVPALRHTLPGLWNAGLQALLTLPVVLWGAIPFYRSAWAGAKEGATNMYTLITIGVSAAFLYSVAVLLFPGLFPAAPGGMLPVYFDTAAVITTLILLGEYLQLRARGRTSEAIRQLAGLQAKSAHVLRDGQEIDLPLADVVHGDLLRVKPGEKIPTDGIVVDGAAAADEAMITGESLPVPKKPGERVIGATTISGGSLLVRADRLGQETLLAQVIGLVGAAQASRAPAQRLADRISAIFVPAVILVAALTFVAWWLWGPAPGYLHGLVNAVAVLIIACPCALGLATPLAVTASVGNGARQGILIKNGEAMEHAATVNVVVVDKTGTLTEGRPRLVAVETDANRNETDVLALAAAVEQYSEHPLAAAVLAAARERNVTLPPVANFESLTGRGVRGQVAEQTVLLGSADFLREQGVAASGSRRNGHTAQAVTEIHVAQGGLHVGTLQIADPLRDTSAAAVADLQRAGVRVVMASGDRAETARAIAQALGIETVHAPVLPTDKVQIVKDLQAAGERVLFAGDGINDAPALAQADVGVALATGTDIAMESADITLLHGDLRKLAQVIGLSRHTRRIIRQNLFWAFIYNTLGVPIAAGVLYPAFGLLLSPIIASAAMSFSSLAVVLNSQRQRDA